MSPHFNSTGSAGRRSPDFQRYLDTLPPKKAREVIAQERQFLNERALSGPSDIRGAAERDFVESMRGFEDRPAGRHGGY
jgi:hypothetical protein